MKKYRKIAPSLCIASALLSTTNIFAAGAGADSQFSGSLLRYSEQDRIEVTEAIVNAKWNLDTDENINAKITFDSITGASPTGAAPSANNQSSTNPSGTNTLILPGTVPVHNFSDDRTALALSWGKKIDDITTNLGLNYSTETDYLSKGISATANYDFNNKHNTITFGAAYNSDTITPSGGVPTIFATIVPPKDMGSRSKTTKDILLGVSQVIDKTSLVQVFFSYSQSDGYHTDPYKVISVVDADGSPLIEGNTGLDLTIYERRPERRKKSSVFVQYKKDFVGEVLDVSYRLMGDNWDIVSHTIDSKYKIRLDKTSYLQPHFRYYNQQQASFYLPFITSSNMPVVGDVNSYASADYRLGNMRAYTLGVEYGRDNIDNAWNISLEYYLQDNQEPGNKFGALLTQKLNPNNKSWMLRYNFEF